MSTEDISEVSSNSCSSKARELKSLMSTGGRGGRMEKILFLLVEVFALILFSLPDYYLERSTFILGMSVHTMVLAKLSA